MQREAILLKLNNILVSLVLKILLIALKLRTNVMQTINIIESNTEQTC